VFWLALPVLTEQVLSFCVGFYDTFLSGRISAEATMAIGLASYVGWLAGLVYGLVGTGTTALVARHWGAGRFDEANRVLNCSLALGAGLGVASYPVIFVLAPVFAKLLDLSPEATAVAVHYLRIDALGYIFTSVGLVGAAALRGVGDMKSPLLIMGTVNVLNVVLSTAFVFGVGPWPELGLNRALLSPMGVDGIVAGTVVARFVGGLMMLAALGHGLSGLKLRRSELSVRTPLTVRVLRVGGPAMADGLLMWCGHFLFLMVIARLGGGRQSAPFAAHVVGVEVEALSYLPAVAWGYAAATLVGQSLGAGQAQRARRAGHVATFQCSVYAVFVSLLFWFGADEIYSLMHRDPAVQQIGAPALRWLALFEIPLVWSITYVHALRGAGDTRTPMFITAVGIYGVRLPVAWVAGIVYDGGLLGAWSGMFADIVLRAALVAWRFDKGRWKEIAL